MDAKISSADACFMCDKAPMAAAMLGENILRPQ